MCWVSSGTTNSISSIITPVLLLSKNVIIPCVIKSDVSLIIWLAGIESAYIHAPKVDAPVIYQAVFVVLVVLVVFNHIIVSWQKRNRTQTWAAVSVC